MTTTNTCIVNLVQRPCNDDPIIPKNHNCRPHYGYKPPVYHPNSYNYGSIDDYGNAQHGYSFVSPFAGYGYVKRGDWDWRIGLWDIQGAGTGSTWKTEGYSSSSSSL